MGLHHVTRGRHDLRGGVLTQAAQPVFFCQHQTIFGPIRLVILVVVRQLKFRKQLIDGVDKIRALPVCLPIGALIRPSFGL